MTAFADMEKPSPLLRVSDGDIWIRCPGCKKPHPIAVAEPSAHKERWSYNGNPDAPTFAPSLLVTWPGLSKRCHRFITNGQIQFLTDCSHELAGQTVALPAWED